MALTNSYLKTDAYSAINFMPVKKHPTKNDEGLHTFEIMLTQGIGYECAKGCVIGDTK